MTYNTTPLVTLVVAMILCYIPLVCYFDVKIRAFKLVWFTPLIVIGLFTLVMYVLESPERNFYLLGLSLILCGIILAISLIGGIGGADFFFATFIILFVQYNPFHIPRVFFALDFFWTLLLVTIALPIIIYFHNVLEYDPPKSVIGMLTYYPRGIPFMLPISFAFVVTLLMEMVL
jgi:hypothetical protein